MSRRKVPITKAAENNYHHGILKSQPFVVSKAVETDREVLIETRYYSNAASDAIFRDFPHAFKCKIVYRLTADCNRMACKLQGPVLETVAGSDILSDGIVEGSVQVSGNGQPIVMLADHQTTGGYAKIATVISADLPALAQLRPGQSVAFDWVDPARAVAAARRQAALLQQIKERLP